MKSNELMIGDLVYAYEALSDNLTNKVVIRVESVSSGITYTGGGGKYCDYDDACPIPLTEEILLANGFEVTDKDAHFKLVKYERQDKWVRYKIFYDGKRRCFALSPIGSCVRIVNVHELQHALRLCNLNELADNLKIE